MAFDDDDDLDEDVASTFTNIGDRREDLSAQSRRRPPMDFSEFLPKKGDQPAATGRAKREPIDFSEFIPKEFPGGQVPTPRARPPEADEPPPEPPVVDPTTGAMFPASKPAPAAPPPTPPAQTVAPPSAETPPSNWDIARRVYQTSNFGSMGAAALAPPPPAPISRPELNAPNQPATWEQALANPTAPNIQQPVAPPAPRPDNLLTEAAKRGAQEGLQETVDAFRDWHEKKTEQDDSYLGKLLQTPLSKGYKDPDWWGASMAYGLAKSSPSLAASIGLGAAGGAAGTAMGGPPGAAIGTFAGSVTGFALGSAVQELAPAYQRARADGLSHEEAVNRAWLQSGVAAAFGAAMGAVPGGGAATSTMKGAVSKALADIFVSMPAIGAAQQATQAAIEGKKLSLEELAQGFLLNAATGGVMVAGHQAINLATGQPTMFTGQPKARSSPEEIAEFLKRARDGAPASPMVDEFQRDVLRRSGLTDDQINAMSDAERTDAYNDTVKNGTWRGRAQQTGEQKLLTGPETAKPRGEPPVEQAAPPVGGATALERRTLRKMGYNDEQIDDMGRKEIVAELGDAAKHGIETAPEPTVPEAKPPVPQPEPQPPAPETQAAPPAVINLGGPAPTTGEGTKASPVKAQTPEDIQRAGQHVDPAPTLPQINAENYKMGHVNWPGLGNMSISTQEGGTRTAPDGSWSNPNFPAPYGHWNGTVGADGQQLDVFFGKDPSAQTAFVIDQYDPKTGKFDEHKIMLGMPDQATAQQTYLAAFNDGSGPSRIGAITPVAIPALKEWAERGRRTKPFAGPPQIASPTAAKPADGAPQTPDEALAKLSDLFAPTPTPPQAPTTGGPRAPTPETPTTYGTPQSDEKDRGAPTTGGPRGGDKTTPPISAEDAVAKAIAELGGRPGEEPAPEDVKAAAELVAKGADPADAFVEVMTPQLEELENAGDQAAKVPVGDETGTRGGEPAEGGELPDGGEVRGPREGTTQGPRTPEGAGGAEVGEGAKGPEGAETAEGPRTPEDTGTGGAEIGRPDRGDEGELGKPEAAGDTEAGDAEAAGPVTEQEQKAASDAIEGALDRIEEAVEANDRDGVLTAADAALKVLADIPERIKNADAGTKEYFDQFPAVIEKMKQPGYVTGKQEYERAPETIESLKDKLTIFASGMSRIGDLKAGTHTFGGYRSRGIGVDVGELTKPAIAALARAIVDWKAKVFIDSGAFSLFKRGLRKPKEVDEVLGDAKDKPHRIEALDFDKILSTYDELANAIEKYNEAEEKVPKPMVVMPDIVGDQTASLALVEKYKKEIGTEAQFDVMRPIVPIQKGELTLAQAYKQIVDTLGTDRFIVGIPSNEKAVSTDELRDFLKEAKPTRIHFLGSTAANRLAPKLQAIVDSGVKLEHLSADANILRSKLYGRQEIEGTRAEAIKKTLQEHGEPETTQQIEGPTPFVQTAAEKEAEKQRIEDAGEKLGGARKDQWTGGLKTKDIEEMSGPERHKYVTKERVFPRPDYAQLVEDGLDPVVAHGIKQIYDIIPTTPRVGRGEPTLEHQTDYASVLQALRDELAKVKTWDDLRKVESNVSAQFSNNSQTLGPATRKRSDYNYDHPGALLWNAKSTAEKAVKEGFPNTEPWQRIYRVAQFYGRKDWAIVTKAEGGVGRRSGLGQVIQEGFDTKEAAQAAAKELYESREKDTGGPKEPERPHLDNLERKGPDVRKERDVAGEDFVSDFGFRGVEFGNWVAGDERQKVVNLAYDALHDLARVMGIPPKALSLNGTLGVGFGSRGRGGRAAAHYEPSYLAINMTKIKGAGSLAHEFAHALDHYLGEVDSKNPYSGATKSISGWDDTKVTDRTYEHRGLPNLSRPLQNAVNGVMQALHYIRESDEETKARGEKELEKDRRSLRGWEGAADRYRNQMRTASGATLRGLSRSLTRAEDQVKIWRRSIEAKARRLAEAEANWKQTDYYANAQKISGKGDYWKRPNEMFARAFEAYVFDKLAEAGHRSDYLVQGVEPTRFGEGYKGNPYPAGPERIAIDKAFDKFVGALHAAEGKLGEGTKIVGTHKQDWNAPEVTDITPVKPITTEEKKDQLEDEMKALDEASSEPQNPTLALASKFAAHLRDGGTFTNILTARKMAQEANFAGDAKAVEEAMELAVVMTARSIAASGEEPKAIFDKLVDMYSRQPKLGTRTSTSMRDQAYSTPVPLAYVASRLARVDENKSVFEPTAGNGALLIEANPDKAIVNELNPERAANLRSQGMEVTTDDAAHPSDAIEGLDKKMDVVLANPPFGAVKEEGPSKVFDLSDIQEGYQTTQIDHAIALRALAAMKDDGRAVLLIGGVSKTADRSEAYNSKAKREFFKVLQDRYNVTDHFTVAGELYERQGAGWPVDVIVIDGRGKSERALPAVDVPRVLHSWDELGGLVDGLPGRREGAAAAAVEAPAGEATPAGDEQLRGGGGGLPELAAGPEQPGEVRGDLVRGPEHGGAGGEGPAPAGAERGASGGGDLEPAAERRPPGITAEEAVAKAIAELTGAPAAPEVSQAPAPDTRTTAEVAKSAVSTGLESADAALAALTQLFGGGKTFGMGLPFTPENYETKVKPLLEKASEKWGEFAHDILELARRLTKFLQDALKWTTEQISEFTPFLVKFIKDVQAGIVKLVKPKAPERAAVTREKETAGQVAYKPQSKSRELGTLSPINMHAATTEALAALHKRVGQLDTYVGKALGYDIDADGLPHFMRKDEETGEVEPHYPFAAEQIDALALALDAIGKGKGIVLGDQTGIGKGRVVAGALRFAMQQGQVPIFVTAKPNLYGDIYRDLVDIGMPEFLGRNPRILETNALPDDLPLDDEGTTTLRKSSTGAKNLIFRDLMSNPKGDLGGKYDMVFTTYNQMQTLEGGDTERRAFLKHLSPNAMIAFDESHEAGGQGADTRKVGTNQAENRAEFTRGLIDNAKGVLYSSATYAKRPGVMDLYRATDMRLAVDRIDQLADVILNGGVPMQQVVATMLAKAGQYIRRERSFAGVDYNTPLVGVDHDTYAEMSGALADIQDFSVAMKPSVARIDTQIKNDAIRVSADNATGGAGANSVTFTSVMHNVINQMLLGFKAPQVAQMAIEAIQRGEKPVITVANTMESLLNDVAEQSGITSGQVMDIDFKQVLLKYLDRTRTIIKKKPFMKKGEKGERHYLTDEELGPKALAAYNNTKASIEAMDTSALAASPIDRIKQTLEDAGYRVGEITGRNSILDYSGDQPVYRTRSRAETGIAGRRTTIRKFNNGELDVILLNQAGSTGLSLHASETYKDQRQRHMMIAQAEGNIDTHMQMLGRVHRTGQVIVPIYSQLVADVPAEKRPAAVLAKKMASLNANTTASRGGALTAKEVPDFMNEYGDMVAAQIIADDPTLNHRLGNPITISAEGAIKQEDAIHKLTGRIPLLVPMEQEELYQRIEDDYNALIEQQDAAGENALEAKTVDLKAAPIERTMVAPERVPSASGDVPVTHNQPPAAKSPFVEAVYMELASVMRQGKPFTPGDLTGKIASSLSLGDVPALLTDKEIYQKAMDSRGRYTTYPDFIPRVMADPVGVLGEAEARKVLDFVKGFKEGQAKQKPYSKLEAKEAAGTLTDLADPYSRLGGMAKDNEEGRRRGALEKFDAFRRATVDAIADADQQAMEYTRLSATRDRFAEIHEMLPIGARMTLLTHSGNIPAIVTRIEHTGRAKNPLALSTWKAHFAIADAAGTMTLPFSRLYNEGRGPKDNRATIELRQTGWNETPAQTLERFSEMGKAAREDRYIATGNLIAAYNWLNNKGQILNYTDQQGNVRQGILTPRKFDLDKTYRARARPIGEPIDVLKWMRQYPTDTMVSKDAHVTLYLNRWNEFTVTASASRRTGGRYYLDKQLTGFTQDFIKRGKFMEAKVRDISDQQVLNIISRLQQLGAEFVDRKIAGPPPAEKIGERPPKTEASIATTRSVSQAPEAQQRRAKLERDLSAIVERVVGPQMRVAFPDTIPLDFAHEGWGDTKAGASVAGTHNAADALIQIAMADPAHPTGQRATAYHEAFHAVEDMLWAKNSPERTVLERQMPRLREWITKNVTLNGKPLDGSKLSDREVRAIAFEHYAAQREGRERDRAVRAAGLEGRVAMARGEPISPEPDARAAGFMAGVHIAIRRGFEKLFQIGRRIKSYLQGHGYRTAEDVFSDVYEGKHAGRPAERPASAETEASHGTIILRPPRPGEVEPGPETVREAWRDPNVSLRYRLQNAWDAGVALKGARQIWDPHIDFLRFKEASEALGHTIPDSMDAYLAAGQYPGIVGERMKDAVRELFDPFYDMMRDRNLSPADVDDYLSARAAPRRNERILEIDPDNEAGSGLSQDDIDEINTRLGPRAADFEAIAELADRIVEHNRELMVEHGLESQATIDQWRADEPQYMPFKGWAESGADDEFLRVQQSPGGGRGYDVRGPETKEALGRFRRADSVIANLFDQTQRTIMRAHKNTVMKTLLRYVQNNPSRWYTVGLARRERWKNPETGMVEYRYTNLPSHLDRVVAAKVNGKTYYIELKHDGLVHAVRSLGINRLGPFLQYLNRLTRVYSAFQTAKNPPFAITNLVKDIQDAAFNLTAEEQSRLLTRYAANILKGKALYAAILGVGRHEGGKLTAKAAEWMSGDNQFRRYFEEWREDGGKISHYGLKDIDEIRAEMLKELGRRIESTTKSVALAPLRLIDPINGKAVKFLEAISEITETQTRLAVYISAREAGMTRARAANLSRRATVDFNKGGPIGHALNAWWAFSKANILGNVTLLRSLRKSKHARRLAYGLMIAGMLLSYWNNMMSGDEDKDGKNPYEKLPAWEKEKNMIIWFPGQKQPFKFPIGYGLQIFTNAGDQMMMRMLGKIGTGEMLMNTLTTTAGAFNPLGSAGSWFDLRNMTHTLFPTVLQWIPDYALNWQWPGKTIHPKEVNWEAGTPRSERYKANTPRTFVEAADQINRLTGGNKVEPGAVSIYPNDIEYAWNFLTGGLGRFVKDSATTIKDYADGIDPPVNRIPLVRSFVVGENPQAAESEAYYKRRTEVSEKANELRRALKLRNVEHDQSPELPEVIQRLARETHAVPGTKAGSARVGDEIIFRMADKKIKDLRSQEAKTRADATLEPAQRNDLIKDLREQMRQTMEDARQRTRKADIVVTP